MKRLLVGFVVLVVLALGALVVAPSFVDLNPYKDRIAAEVGKATGRALAIDGAIALRLLPTPRVTLSGVRVGNIEGAVAPDMAEIEALDATVALGPLLRGEFQVTSIALVAPVVTLERLADGRANWELAGTQAPGAEGGGAAVSFDSVTVERGTFIYRDAVSGQTFQADAVDLAAKAGSLEGPFEVEGKAVVAGVAFGVKARSGALGRASVPVAVELALGEDERVAFDGTVAGLDAEPEASGRVTASAPSLAKLLALAGVEAGTARATLDQPFSAEATVAAGAAAVSLTDLTATFGETRVTGAFEFTPGAPARFDGILAINRVDLDALLAVAPAGGEAEPAEAATSPLVPPGLTGDLAVNIDAVVLKGEVVQQVRLDLAFEDGVVTLQQGGALLPGGSDLALFGTAERGADGPRFDGQVELASDNLRSLLAWAGVAADTVPADRLRRFGLASQVSATLDGVALDDIDLRIDTTRVTGSLTATPGPVPAIKAALALDKLNLDAYLPAPSGEARPPALPADLDLDLALSAGQMTVRGQSVAGLTLAARLADGHLSVTRLVAQDLAGAAVAFEGALDPFQPRYDGTLRLEGQSLAGLARLAGLDPALRLEDLGAVRLDADLAGDAAATRFAATVATGPFDAKLDGTVDLAAPAPAVDVTYDATVRDATRALAAFALAARVPDLGPTRLTGAYKGTAEGGDGTLRAEGRFGVVEGSGHVDAAAFDVALKASGASRNAMFAVLGLAADGPDGDYAVEGTAKGTLADAALDIRGTAAGATARLAGQATGMDRQPAFSGSLTLDHPDMDGFLAALGRPPTGAPGPLHLDLTLAGDEAAIQSQAFNATLGSASLTGGLSAKLDGPVPFIDAALHAGDLVLDPYLGDSKDESAERWSTERLDLEVLRSLDGHVLLDAASLTVGALRLSDALIEAKLANGVMTLDTLSGRVFGGALQANGRLAVGELHGVDLTLAMQGVDARQALAATAGYEDLSGRLDLDARLDSLGTSEADLVGNLAGDARVALHDGVIEGYDLTAINERLKRLDSIVDFAALAGTSLQGGSTPIRQADGTFVVERGVARSTDLRALMDGAEATGEATIDLPRWIIDANGRAQLLGHSESPPLGVKVRGPLDAPTTKFDTKALEAFVAKRAVGAAIQKFGDEDTQNLFGIITGQPQAQPEPEPVPPDFGTLEDTGELPAPAFPEPSAELPAEDAGELPAPALPEQGTSGGQTQEQLLQDLLQGVLGGQN